jgi:molybdopterin molybdotransferase
MITWQEARRIIHETIQERSNPTETESLALEDVLGRVLAEEIRADRPYPPFNRSTRDGYALRCADLARQGDDAGQSLVLAGEIRAGQSSQRTLQTGECAAIMTGASVPEGADAVVMREFADVEGDQVIFRRSASLGDNIVPCGSEACEGQLLLSPGVRLGYAELALAAQVGRAPVCVRVHPRLAILSTGDEVVAHEEIPGPFQIRNINSLSLAHLATLAGAEPVALGNAPDNRAALRDAIQHGLAEDALVLSGGVSMGKYDLVEDVLAELGAEFFFDAVAIRPGRPAVFGYCQGKPVFGLPGNPLSTMVTFDLLVALGLDVLSGAQSRPLGLLGARMAHNTEHNPALAHFLPAKLSWNNEEPTVEEIPWQGSGDLVALSLANCLLYLPLGRPRMAAGEWARVLPRRGAL